MVTARRGGILVPLITEAKDDKSLRYFAPNVDTVTLELAIVIKPQ